jgi:hypothetical protein
MLLDIANESRVSDTYKDKDESIFRLETLHPTKDNNILEQPRIDFMESWFHNIVGQAMQSGFGHIQLNFTPVYFGNAHVSLVAALIYSPILEFFPHITWMIEWLHWKSTYT